MSIATSATGRNPSVQRQLQDTQNPIQIENAKPGTPGWDDFASIAQQDAISGFASKTSVNHGDSIDFYVTTTAPSFTIDIFRTGWYQGIGARLMQSLGSFPGVHQPIPAPDPVTGMVSCTNWTKTTTLNVPSTWTTGVYLAKLSASNGNKSFIVFDVRDDGGTEPILFQDSVTTYQAYNQWGGVSLYANNTNGSSYKYAHATKVSFDRPYDPLDGNGAGHFFAYEYPFIRWAESQGYNMSYITDVDTHTNVNPLTNHRVYLSVGHDEYWSKGMRDNVTNALNHGVNLAFFSANTDYWQIRFEPNSRGDPNRVEVGYKDTATFNAPPGPDPQWGVNNAIVTTRWRDDPVNLPENGLIGVMYQDQVNKDYAYVVQNAGNWIYAGTGFANGTSVPGIVGYEYDKTWNNGASPPGLTVLSNSPVVGCCEGSGSSFSNSTLYTAASGAQVFAGGTIQWSWGLDNYGGGNYVNAGIQKTTANILNAFSSGGSSPAPAVSLAPASLTYSGQTVGTTSAAQTVTLTNSGTAALTIGSIGVTGTNSGDFSQTNTCPISPSTLAAGGNCAISVTFTPGASGTRTASLSVTDNAAGSPQSVALTGTGVAAAPSVTLAPNSLGFGSQAVGTTSAAQSTTLTNSGTAPLTITSITTTGTNSGDFAQTTTCPLSPSTLNAGANCSISVTFSPTAAGSRSASVSIADNAAGSPQTVGLSGTGTAPGVSLTPGSLGFGSQLIGTTSASQSSTLKNTGTAPLSISSISMTGANAGDYGESGNCPISPSTLAANATCTISVTFSPTAAGSRSASVSITDNASGSPQALGLSGTGTTPAPAVSLSPTSLSFGSQRVGTTSGSQSSTLTNTGTAPLTFNSITLGGTNSSDYTESDNCPVSPATLAVSGTCTISVTFTPSATGSRAANVSISDNASDSPESLGLSGTGTAPAVTLSPTSLTFATQVVGTTSPAQNVTLTNSGGAPLSISNIAVTGTNSSDFGETSTCMLTPATLAAGTSCTISVTFTPSATGARSASVSITDDASSSPQSVGLSGTGAATAPAVTLTPTSLSFGSQQVGTTSSSQSSTLKNTGTAPLTISSILITGANSGDYAQTNTCPISPLTLAVNATCSISVTFAPSATGSRSAGVTISDDASDSPQGVSLSGTGTAPAVTMTPASLSFGSQPVGTTSTAQSTTLKNSGTAPLSINSIGITGTNAGDYNQTNTCPVSPSTLAVNATCTISVTLKPTATGSRTASVSISDNASGSPHTVGLSGTGSTNSIAFDKNLGSKTENAGSTTMTLTTNATSASNARIVLFVNWYDPTRTLTSVSGGGLTWTVDAQTKDTTDYHGGIASASAPSGLPSGTVITATFSGSVLHGLIAASSFTGIATSGAVDAKASNAQDGVAGWTATVTTTNATDLVVGWSGIDTSATSTPTAPNTELFDFGDATFGDFATAVYRIESTTGAKTLNGTWSRATGATANNTTAASYKGG